MRRPKSNKPAKLGVPPLARPRFSRMRMGSRPDCSGLCRKRLWKYSPSALASISATLLPATGTASAHTTPACWNKRCSSSRAVTRRLMASSFLDLVGRGKLKPVGIYLLFLVNNYFVNLFGIPVGTLRGLDSDGRSSLNSAPSCRRDRTYQANGRENVSYG